MTQFVVDGLESAQVAEAHAEPGPALRCQPGGVFEGVECTHAIRYSGQAIGASLTFQAVLEPFAFADVLDLRDEVERCPVGAPNEHDREVSPDLGSVAAQVALVDAVSADLARQALLQHVHVGLQVLEDRQLLERALRQLESAVAEHLLERRVRVQELTTQADECHADRRVQQREFETRLRKSPHVGFGLRHVHVDAQTWTRSGDVEGVRQFRRTRDEVSLACIDSQLHQAVELRLGLHPFGDHHRVDLSCDLEDAACQTTSRGVGIDRAGDRDVDLQDIGTDLENVREAREACTDVIDREPPPDATELVDSVHQLVVVGDSGVLGQLHHDPVGPDGSQQASKFLGRKQLGRRVHRHVGVLGELAELRESGSHGFELQLDTESDLVCIREPQVRATGVIREPRERLDTEDTA